MTNFMPCDYDERPTSLQLICHSQTSLPCRDLTTTQAAINVDAILPTAIFPHTPRPMPYESRSVARCDTCYKVRKSASFPSTNNLASIKEHSSSSTDVHTESHPPGLSLRAGGVQNHHSPRIERTAEPEKSQHTAPLALPACKNLLMNDMPKIEATGIRKNDTKAKPSWTSKLRQQSRASEIFNLSFSFKNPSLRCQWDHTPQISPRTSLSPDSTSSTSLPDEPFKRQRVDSSGPKLNIDPNIPGSAIHRLQGYNFGHTPTEPVHFWFADDMMCLRTVAMRTEAHPGFPVDLTGTSNVHSASEVKEDAESYHKYLDEDRRSSSPTDEMRMLFDMEMDEHKPHIQAETLNKEARILGISSNIEDCKRSNVSEMKSRKSPRGPGVNISGFASVQTRNSRPKSDSSTDRFLVNVRASQEARASRKRDGDRKLFVNESCDGWLGDGRL
jgi:hypothetical protein